MRLVLAVLASALLLAPPAHADGPGSGDPVALGFCKAVGLWEVCFSRDGATYCYRIWTGMPPAIADCVQLVGP